LVVIDAGNDAFDDAYVLYVNGVQYSPPGIIAGTNIPFGYQGAVATMSGLDVASRYIVSQTLSSMTNLVQFSNPTGSSITATITLAHNFGSDGGTIVRGTSSGDTTIDTSDHWVVTSDGGPSDPVNLSVLAGPGLVPISPISVSTNPFGCAGTEGLQYDWSLTVPAGATKSLLFVGGLGDVVAPGNTVAGSLAVAAMFNDDSNFLPGGPLADVLTGITNAELATVQNWNFVVGTE